MWVRFLGWDENPIDRGAWWATVHRIIKESETTEAAEHTHVTKSWCEWLLSFLLANSKFSQAGDSFLIKNNVYLGEYYLLCGWGTGEVWDRVLFIHVMWGKNPCVTLLERWSNHWFLLSLIYWYYWYHLSTPGMECQIKEPLSLYISWWRNEISASKQSCLSALCQTQNFPRLLCSSF